MTFAASGTVQVHTSEGRWLVPPQLAVWVPAGVMHRVEVLTDAELWMVHWQPSAVRTWGPPTLPARAFALRVTKLLRSLLDAAFAPDTGADKAELIVKLMLHELNETADAPTFLPMPTSPVGRRVADLAIDDHKNRLDIGELASRAATSVRTLSRLFPSETGLTFKAWRQRARIVHAIAQLGRGDTIARVRRIRLRQHCCILIRLPAGDGHDADGVSRPTSRADRISVLMRRSWHSPIKADAEWKNDRSSCANT